MEGVLWEEGALGETLLGYVVQETLGGALGGVHGQLEASDEFLVEEVGGLLLDVAGVAASEREGDVGGEGGQGVVAVLQETLFSMSMAVVQ